jgi:excisionase family DNA binding protein
MSKKTSPESALFVRLPTSAVDKLDRASEALGIRKKDLVAGLLAKYVDPDSRGGLDALGALSGPRLPLNGAESGPSRGSYSFQPYDLPEVLTPEQAGQFLQIDATVVVQMAQSGALPGRKLGGDWRFSRAALVSWLSTPPKP